MSEATQPIIPWMGGKRRLAGQLLPLFPPHECYVELFTGGAALFFMREHPVKTDVINDINGELVNLYRVVRCHFDEFCRHFEFMLGSREDWDWFQAVNLKTLTDIQRAVRFFFYSNTPLAAKSMGRILVMPPPAGRLILPRCVKDWQRRTVACLVRISSMATG